MRVLFVFNSGGSLSKMGVGYGGTTRIKVALYKECIRSGHKVYVFALGSEHEFFKNEAHENLELIEIPDIMLKLFRHKRNIRMEYLVRMFSSILLLHKLPRNIEIAFSHSTIHESLPGFLVAKVSKAKWATSFYHVVPWRSNRGIYRSLLASIVQKLAIPLLRKADLIFTQVEPVLKYLIKYGIRREKVTLIGPGGVDEKALRASQPESHSDACYMGRIDSVKGVPDLIKAWKIVCEKLPQAKLVITGFGTSEEKAKLIRKITAYNLELNIDFLGFVSEMKKYSLLKSSKIFLFPSYEDPCSIAVSEALMCGLPVVRYADLKYKVQYPGIVEVAEGDIKGFANAILALLSDEALRKTFSSAARNSRMSLSLKSVINHMISSMENVCRGVRTR